MKPARCIPLHIEINASEPRFFCRFCQRRFNTRSSCWNHQYCDGTQKPYGCCYCPRRFVNRSHLLFHMRGHLDIRPFVCSICAKTFRANYTLRRHSRRVHADHRKLVAAASTASVLENGQRHHAPTVTDSIGIIRANDELFHPIRDTNAILTCDPSTRQQYTVRFATTDGKCLTVSGDNLRECIQSLTL